MNWHKFSALRGAALAVCTFSPALASAAPVLDQVHDATGGGFSAAVVASVSRAQTFTAGISGELSAVSLMLNRGSESTIGSFTLSILDATGGVPDGSGAALFTQDYSVLGLPLGGFSFTFTDFDISAANVTVAAGQQYAIAVTYSFADGAPDWLLWDTNPGYANGALFQGDGDLSTSWRDNQTDGGFRTFVDVAQVPEPTTFAILSVALAGLALTRRRAS